MRSKGRIFTRYGTTVIGLNMINANRKRLFGLKGKRLVAANDNRRALVAANLNNGVEVARAA